MTQESLKIIEDAMSELGIEYELGFYNGDQDIYFTGEYQEVPSSSENGEEESTFILNGFSNTTQASLEECKEKIKEKFNPKEGYVVATQTGSVVAIFYERGSFIPTRNDDLKTLKINLMIKEWRVK